MNLEKGLVPRLINFVPKNGNLTFGKNDPYLTHFQETRKSEIPIIKFQTNLKFQITITKTEKHEEPAPNPLSRASRSNDHGVFVLNFENWDLYIV